MTASFAQAPASGSPLSAEHLNELTAANGALGKIRRVVSVARFDAWTVGAFGVLTCLFGFTHASSIVMGIGMICVAAVELRGAERVRRLEPRGTRVLGWNQLALGMLLVVYALWQIYVEMTGGGAFASLVMADPQVAQMLRPYENLMRSIALAVYGAVIGVAILAQGGLSLYYFRRGEYLRRYLERTPGWIVAVQRGQS